ncbi:hypothetical protein ACIBG8_21445 [Nonomuraea sp. NPDC050556]|uniref:hypothetical protein n=1 Tax=Nonomuraea sp. NPDC050556 TaxID=3364369 RepID=UPI00379DA881
MEVAQELGRLQAASVDVEAALVAGERALHSDGDLQASRRLFDEAYQAADREGDGPALARAALGLGGLWVHEHRTAADAGMVRARQRRALTVIDRRSSVAFRLRARLAGEHDYRAGGHDAIMEVLEEARSGGDPVCLAETLSLAHHCLLGPDHVRLRLELAEELVDQATRTGRRGDLLMGLMWQTVDLFLAGDPHAERRLEELRVLLEMQDHRAVAFVVSAIEVMLAIRAGRFDEAEQLADACAGLGAAAGDIDMTGWYGGQLGAIRWFQGRIGELVPVLTELVHSPALSAVDNSYFAGTAVAAAAAGERRLAVGMLAKLRLPELPRSSTWLLSMYGVVEAAGLLGDADTAAEAYELLLPYAGLPVVASLGVACFGSVQHALGVAALTAGQVDRAIEHLRAGVADNLALGHWPALALTRWRLGQALAVVHEPSAERELAEARREADELGMVLPGAQGAPRSVAAECRRHGKQWQLEIAGRVVLVDHSVGMRHLAMLIANPGSEIRATDLAAGPGAAESLVEAAQPILDDQAKRTYKQRLEQLAAEIDELEAMNDTHRASALRAERDWLLEELAAATGMGGRARGFAGSSERARIAVGKAIRRALARIAEADPVVGEELRRTVQTGVRCSYRPR